MKIFAALFPKKKYIVFPVLISFIGVSLFAPISVSQNKVLGSIDIRTTTAEAAGSGVAPPDVECGIFGDATLTACFAWVGYLLFFVPASAILLISGVFFDKVLDVSLDKTKINPPFVSSIWKTVRDITNLFFIFILLYIALSAIFNFGNYKKLLATLIVVALLVNFSAFFARIVIDFSNVIATGFYSAITSGGGSVSEIYLEAIDPQKVVNKNSFQSWLNEGGSVAALFFLYFIAAIILLVIAYALFVSTFLLLGRLISLWFLVILSPLAFALYALPKGSSFSSKWFGKLINQSLVAPIFLFGLYVIAALANSTVMSSFSSGGTDFTSILFDAVTSGTVIVIALLMLVNYTRSMSGGAGSMAMKFAGGAMALTAVGRVGKMMRRGAASTARYARDRAAYRLSESERMQTLSEKMPRLGLALDQGLDKMGAKRYEKRLKQKEKRLKEFGERRSKESRREIYERERGAERVASTLRAQGVSEEKINEAKAKAAEALKKKADEKVAERRKKIAESFGYPPISEVEVGRKEQDLAKKVREYTKEDTQKLRDEITKLERMRDAATTIDLRTDAEMQIKEAKRKIAAIEKNALEDTFNKDLDELKQMKKRLRQERFAGFMRKVADSEIAEWNAAKSIAKGGDKESEEDRLARLVAEKIKQQEG